MNYIKKEIAVVYSFGSHVITKISLPENYTFYDLINVLKAHDIISFRLLDSMKTYADVNEFNF